MSDYIYSFFMGAKRKFEEAFFYSSPTTEEKRQRTDAFENPKNALLCKTTSWHFNCGLNCLTHFLYNKLQKNELQNLFNNHPEYNDLLKTFQEYYALPKQPTWNEIKDLLVELKAPHDREAVLAPVLRKHLGKILAAQPELLWELEGGTVFSEYLTQGEINDIAEPIFDSNQAFFLTLKQEYDSAIENTATLSFTHEEQIQAIQKIQINNQKINNQEINEPNVNEHILFIKKNEVLDDFLKKAEEYWLNNGGCQNYTDYFSDLKNSVMVSADQLTFLCSALNISTEISTPNFPSQKLGKEDFALVLKVYNNQGVHWEYEEPDANPESTKKHNEFYPTVSYYDNDVRLGEFKTYGSQAEDQTQVIKDYVFSIFAKPENIIIDLTREEAKAPEKVKFYSQKSIAPKTKINSVMKEIQGLNKTLTYLEVLNSSKEIDLDLGNISLSVVLNPLLGNQKDSAWLSDIFVERYISEKIAQSGQTDIYMFITPPTSLTLIRACEKAAKQNPGINKILWPIWEGKHFYLITVAYEQDKNQVQVGCIDGFNKIEKQKKFIEKAAELAKFFYPHADLQIAAHQKISHQMNESDCGVVVCYFANHFIKKSLTEFQGWLKTSPTPKCRGLENAEPYTPYRKKVAEIICDAGYKLLLASGKQELITTAQKFRGK